MEYDDRKATAGKHANRSLPGCGKTPMTNEQKLSEKQGGLFQSSPSVRLPRLNAADMRPASSREKKPGMTAEPSPFWNTE